MKRLVPFIEGKGDETAIPALVRKLINHHGGTDVLRVDPPYRAQSVGKLLKQDARKTKYPDNWRNWLAATLKKPHLGGVLLVLDGDSQKVASPEYRQHYGTNDFCARDVARFLAEAAKDVGAGAGFSVAVVFAMPEFESWLIASLDRMSGIQLAGEITPIPGNIPVPENTDAIGRDAKGWLRHHLAGYRPTAHQAQLARCIEPAVAEARSRSFRRMSDATKQLIEACRSGRHCISPTANSR